MTSLPHSDHPAPDFTASVTAVLANSGRPAGAGFLFDRRRIVTCAHVVRMLGAGPGGRVWVRFHDAAEAQPAQVLLESWQPPDGADVAVLELEGDPPSGAAPLPLGEYAAGERPFATFGYPPVGALSGGGQIVGLAVVDGRPLLQLRSVEVTPGFSGGPVWDPGAACVVGMITSVTRPDEFGRMYETAFATPAQALPRNAAADEAARRPANPFGPRGRLEDPSAFLSRPRLSAEIFAELRKGASLSLVGDSQSGKSSLLWHITRAGPQALGLPPEEFIYLTLELVRSEDEFFECLCDGLGVDTLRANRLYRALRRRKCVVCLDEIEKMTWTGFTAELRSELRGLADGAGAPLRLVIASRTPLSSLFADSAVDTSPLGSICAVLRLPAFTLAEARALARLRLDETGLSLPPEDVAQAWTLSAGHPGRLELALKDAFARRYLNEDRA